MTCLKPLYVARFQSSRRWLLAWCSFALLIVPAACERNDKIITFREPKDPPPTVMDNAAETAPSSASSSPPPQTSDAALPPFTWTAPPSWKADPDQVEFRTAGWNVGSGDSKAEITISSPFSTNAIDLPQFIAKWRKDVDLPAASDASDVQPQPIQIGDQPGFEVDLTGPAASGKQPRRQIVAFAGDPSVYFFKIAGPADVVAQQKAAFDQFLSSVKFKAVP